MSLFDFQILQWFFITTSMAESSEWKVICCFSDTTSVFNCNVKEKLFIGGQIVCFVDKSINRMKSLTSIFSILLYNFFIVIFKQNNKIFKNHSREWINAFLFLHMWILSLHYNSHVYVLFVKIHEQFVR